MKDIALAPKRKIGNLIKKARERKELTQGELAKVIGTSQSKLSKIESGQFTTDLVLWTRMCNYLDIEMADIIRSKKGS